MEAGTAEDSLTVLIWTYRNTSNAALTLKPLSINVIPKSLDCSRRFTFSLYINQKEIVNSLNCKVLPGAESLPNSIILFFIAAIATLYIYNLRHNTGIVYIEKTCDTIHQLAIVMHNPMTK